MRTITSFVLPATLLAGLLGCIVNAAAAQQQQQQTQRQQQKTNPCAVAKRELKSCQTATSFLPRVISGCQKCANSALNSIRGTSSSTGDGSCDTYQVDMCFTMEKCGQHTYSCAGTNKITGKPLCLDEWKEVLNRCPNEASVTANIPGADPASTTTCLLSPCSPDAKATTVTTTLPPAAASVTANDAAANDDKDNGEEDDSTGDKEEGATTTSTDGNGDGGGGKTKRVGDAVGDFFGGLGGGSGGGSIRPRTGTVFWTTMMTAATAAVIGASACFT